MSPDKGINPSNPSQARVFFDAISAHYEGLGEHPQKVMDQLSPELGFRVLDSVPQSMMDGWDFWIEFDSMPIMPKYFRDVPWKPVGQA